jgi:hypothetical protein
MILEKIKKARGYVAKCRCDYCDKEFYRVYCEANRFLHQLCSQECRIEYRKENYRPSEETKKKMSDAQLGKRNHRYGKNASDELRKKLRLARANRIITDETRLKISLSNNGHIVTEETKRKISEANKGKIAGDKHPFWKGGITPKNKRIRNTSEYKEWRGAVFERDNWTCQDCGKRGGFLHAHHIRLFSKFPKLRFDINNGITLCRECHRKTFQKQLVA